MVVATEAAFCKALFVTSKGSIIPAFTISTVFPVTTFKPWPATSGASYSVIPALLNITSNGLEKNDFNKEEIMKNAESVFGKNENS